MKEYDEGRKERKPDPQKLRDAMARITVKAWTDTDYKRKLFENPVEVLRDEGVPIPEEDAPEVRFVENTSKIRYFVLPEPPQVLTLDMRDLRTLAAQRLAIQLELF